VVANGLGGYLQNGGNKNLCSTKILKLRRNLTQGPYYVTKTVGSIAAAFDGVDAILVIFAGSRCVVGVVIASC